jgi:5-methylcytosine-specific restriction enzyme subunit McrC
VQRVRKPATRLPVDTKYKLYDRRKVDAGDLYQLLTYAYAFGDEQRSPCALLIYPSDDERWKRFKLRLQPLSLEMETELHVFGVHIPTILGCIRAGQRPAPELAEEILTHVGRDPSPG